MAADKGTSTLDRRDTFTGEGEGMATDNKGTAAAKGTSIQGTARKGTAAAAKCTSIRAAKGTSITAAAARRL